MGHDQLLWLLYFWGSELIWSLFTFFIYDYKWYVYEVRPYYIHITYIIIRATSFFTDKTVMSHPSFYYLWCINVVTNGCWPVVLVGYFWSLKNISVTSKTECICCPYDTNLYKVGNFTKSGNFRHQRKFVYDK